MKKILQDKLRHLFCGDDGAALVITLGVFFFMYIFCAGVYAIGMAVKEKIHLQNACDAAAYSAAVVQADSISRIATLNRALGWTYAQMCRRQMDYIVARWLQGVRRKYAEDLQKACEGNKVNGVETGCPYHRGEGWDRGYWIYSTSGDSLSLGKADLNLGRHFPHVDRVDNDIADDGSIQARLENFEGVHNERLDITGHLHEYRDSLFEIREEYPSIDDLGRQIDQDKIAVDEMSDAIDSFARNMPNNIRTAAMAILRANIPTNLHERCEIVIRQSENPLSSSDGYFRDVRRTRSDELRMIGNGGATADEGEDGTFGIGSLTWFVFCTSDDFWEIIRGHKGIQRGYSQYAYENERLGVVSKSLYACWHYAYNKWACKDGTEPYPHQRVHVQRFDSYTGEDAKKDDDGSPGWRDSRLKEKSRFISATARPKFLEEAYFGPKGTITIGIVRHQTSPWYSIFRNVSERGFYAAFNQTCDLFCFASAKAGYKLYSTQDGWERYYEGNARAWKAARDYCVDWKPTRSLRAKHPGSKGSWDWVMEWVQLEDGRWVYRRVQDSRGYYKVAWHLESDGWRQGWNLTQSDWDAVMIPVCKGGSKAEEIAVCTRPEYFRGGYDYRFEPVWTGMDTDFLQDIVDGSKWYSLESGKLVEHADGDFGVMCAGGTDETDPDGVWGEHFVETSSGWNGWWDIPHSAATHVQAVNSRWNIGNPGGKLKWTEIMTMMFH